MYSPKNAQPNQSIIDGITCLQALAAERGPVGMTALARKLGIETTRMNRIMKTLAYLGLAMQTEDRKYVCGPGVHVLAAQSLFASGLLHRAIPALEQLQRQTGRGVALGLLWRDKVSYLYHSSLKSPENPIARVGSFPAAKSGIGMAILAAQSEATIRALYGAGGCMTTPYPDVEALWQALQGIRQQGYAFIATGTTEPTHTLAMGMGSPVYCAVGIAGLNKNEDLQPCLAYLKEAAGKMIP